MNAPDLSIVLPIRNGVDSRALVGLVSELRRPGRSEQLTIELIVVDDSSTDATVEFAKSAIAGLENARVIELEANGGPGRARNVGLEVAQGEFIAFVDADDVVAVEVISEGVRRARRTAADVVSLGYREIDKDGEITEFAPEPVSTLGPLLTQRAAVWRFVLRVEFLRRHGVQFPELYYAEDVGFVLRVAEANPRVESVPYCAYTYYLHSSGLSGTTPSARRAEVALEELLSIERATTSPEVATLARLWAARIAVRSWGVLLGVSPRTTGRLIVSMIANPKASWLLKKSTLRARKIRPRG